MKILFYHFYKFYNKFWPNNDPDLYSFLLTIALVFCLFIDIHLLYWILKDPSASISLFSPILFLCVSLAMGYWILLRNRNYREILLKTKADNILYGKFGAILVLLLFLFVIISGIVFANIIRANQLV